MPDGDVHGVTTRKPVHFTHSLFLVVGALPFLFAAFCCCWRFLSTSNVANLKAGKTVCQRLLVPSAALQAITGEEPLFQDNSGTFWLPESRQSLRHPFLLPPSVNRGARYTFFFHDDDVIHMHDCENALYWVGLEPNADIAKLCHSEVGG